MAKRAPKPKVVAPEPAREAPPPEPPLTLDQIAGQDRALSALRAAMDSRRIHHAWIFHGPYGVGKFSAAVAFAACLLDPTTAPDLSGRLSPDPESPAQRLIRAWAHPDLHIVTKELAAVSRDEAARSSKQTTISKQVIEEFLIEPAARTRSIAGDSFAGKVFIVDEAELMALPGQNALLKTLEEPAPGRVIILVTSAEERLLPTIRSRSQRVAFTPLDEPTMRGWLDAHGPKDLDPARREWLLAYAAGSPGAFVSAHRTGLYAWHEAVAPMLADADAGRFPVAMGATMAKLVDDWAAAFVEQNKNASKDAANRAGARRLFRLVAQHYRARLRDTGTRSPDGFAPGALRAIDAIADAERNLDTNVPMLFVMENMAAQLAAPGR